MRQKDLEEEEDIYICEASGEPQSTTETPFRWNKQGRKKEEEEEEKLPSLEQKLSFESHD